MLVNTTVWNPHPVSCRTPVRVFIDTGAGGGNYASEAFIKTVESASMGGRSIVTSTGNGSLRAANPRISKRISKAFPMEIVGSYTLLLVIAPADQVFKATVRVVVDLP